MATNPTTTPEAQGDNPGASPGQTPTGAPAEGAAGEAPAALTPDWRTALDNVDRDELLRHPKFSGLIGDLAQRQARQIEQRNREEWQAAERRRLRETDPVAFANADREAEQRQRDAAEAEQRSQGILFAEAKRLQSKLPLEVQQAIGGRDYEGGVSEYLDAVVHATAEHEAKKLAPATIEANRQEALAQLNGGEAPEAPSPGSSAPGGPMDQDEFDRGKNNPAFIKANMPRINAGLAAGTITH